MDEMKYFLLNPVLRANEIKEDESISSKLHKLGDNTGNMVFVNAVKEQISFCKEDWIREEAELTDRYIYILPCSNFLHVSNRWIEPLADIIEKYPIKIVLVGLGAQAGLNEGTEIVKRLSRKQRRFFELIAERCKSIGVRGEFTAECLEKLGIKNSRIIGCPSIYRGLDGEFEKMEKPSLEKVLVTITPAQQRASEILDIAIKRNADWIMQTKDEIVSLYDKNKAIRFIQKQRRFPGIGWEELVKYQNTNARIFWNFAEWNAFIRNGGYTFAFGSRFHGNMMALRNGVPALWFVHDMRTWELVNTLKVPAVGYDDEIKTAELLLEKCDYSDFYKQYPSNIKNYTDFLHENEIC